MRILGRSEGPHAFGFAGDRFGVWDFGAKVRSAAGFRGTTQASSPTNVFRAIPHNSKCRYDERGAAHHHYSLFIKKPPVPPPIPNY